MGYSQNMLFVNRFCFSLFTKLNKVLVTKFLLVGLITASLHVHSGTLVWDQITQATHYQVQINNSGTWENINQAQPQTANSIDISSLEKKEYTFRVSGCVEEPSVIIHCGESVAEYSASLTVDLANEFNPDSDFILEIPAARTVTVPAENTSSTEIAVVPGEMTVTNQGAAKYSIDIDLPKGVGGIRPNISLSYSSLGGSNIAGVGWSLAAASSISRCQKTLENDGGYQEILFNENDALCYGGQKLRLVVGSNLTNGAEYQLDKDPYTKVIQTNSGASTYFVMYKPSGERLTFGNTLSSVLTDSKTSQIYHWKISSQKSRFDQEITYHYNDIAEAEKLLESIEYSGNQIDFVYEDRDDQSTLYYLGNKTIKSKRLDRIDVKNHNNVLVRSYHLNYRNSTFSSRTLLSNIKVCNDTIASVCTQPTIFDYSDENLAGFASQDTILTLDNFTPTDGESNCTVDSMHNFCPLYKLNISDLNKDGKPELLVSTRDGNSGKVLVFENNNGVFSLNQSLSEFNVPLKNYFLENEFQKHNFHWQVREDEITGNRKIELSDTRYFDWLGDGIDRPSPGSSSNSEAFADYYTFTADVNMEYDMGAYSYGQKDVLFDYNNDGLIDRFIPLVFESESLDHSNGNTITTRSIIGNYYLLEINRSTGSLYSGEALSLPEPDPGCPQGHCTYPNDPDSFEGVYKNFPNLAGDFNGDGLRDKLNTSSKGYSFNSGTNTGRDFTFIANGYSMNNGLDSRMTALVDINGDRKDDLVYVNNNNVYWKRSLSDSNAPAASLTSLNWGTINNANPFLWRDLDGDSQPELIYFDIATQKIRIRFDSNTNEKILDKLTSVSTGFGKNHNIEYKKLTDATVYEKANDAQNKIWGQGSKVRDIISTMPVVSRHEETKGLDASGYDLTETTTFFYKGLKSQAGGKGSLGFAEVISTTQSNNITTHKYFKQAPPFEGQEYKKITKQGEYILSDYEVTNWWDLSVNNASSRFVTPQLSTTKSYYTNASNGVISGSKLANTTTTTTAYSVTTGGYQYPTLDSTTVAVIDHFDLGSKTSIITQWYSNEDTANWWINRPTKVKKEFQRLGTTSRVQVTEFQYKNENGAKEFEIKEPDSTDYSQYLKTHFQYDSYGNLIQKTACSRHFIDTCSNTLTPDTNDDAFKVFRRKNFDFETNGRYPTAIRTPEFTEQSFHNFNKFGQAEIIKKNQYDLREGLNEFLKFDSLGNVYFSYTNTGASMEITKQLCSSRNDCPPNAIFAITKDSTGGINKIDYLDYSGNKVKEGSQLLDGTWTFVEKRFDVLGREISVSRAFKPNATVYRESISYDDVGRKASATNASSQSLITNFSYFEGLVTQNVTGTYSDEISSGVLLNRTRKEKYNGRSELLQTIDDSNETVTYEYSALETIAKATGIDGGEIIQHEDIYGRITQLIDPDKGTELYRYNALNEKVELVRADTSTKTDFRNRIGQVIKSETVKGTEKITYTFDFQSSPFLHTESTTNASTTYSYDTYHRLSGKSITLDGKTWSNDTYYDEYGRLFRETDISGNNRGLQYQYDFGTPTRIFELKTGKTYYRASTTDSFSNITRYTLGSGTGVIKEYDPSTGYLRSLEAGLLGYIQNQYYRYDQLGNLRYRSDQNGDLGNNSVVETFTYDNLNRLLSVNQENVGITQSITYNAVGNILTKSDVASGSLYGYGTQATQCNVTPGPHAVTSIGTERAYCYDVAGNQTHAYKNNALTRQISYTLFAKPSHINSTEGDSWFNYDAKEATYKRIDDTRRGQITTYYVDGNEVIYHPDGSNEIKRYIKDIAIHTIKNTGEEKLNYVFNDHLGSGSIITDKFGTVEQRISFDAFGKRRNAITWDNIDNPYSNLTTLDQVLAVTQKGYTGHQQVDHASIIHMGGRIYDPGLGRFVQPDPVVQAPKDGQNLNRFTYVFNNPLSNIDPTGYICFRTMRAGPPICTGGDSISGWGVDYDPYATRQSNTDTPLIEMTQANESDSFTNSTQLVNGPNSQNVDPDDALALTGFLLGLIEHSPKNSIWIGKNGKIYVNKDNFHGNQHTGSKAKNIKALKELAKKAGMTVALVSAAGRVGDYNEDMQRLSNEGASERDKQLETIDAGVDIVMTGVSVIGIPGFIIGSSYMAADAMSDGNLTKGTVEAAEKVQDNIPNKEGEPVKGQMILDRMFSLPNIQME